MSEWWAPQPLRGLCLDGELFKFDQAGTMTKSKPDAYSEQRAKDGTLPVRGGRTRLRPPPAGPRLEIADDIAKAKSKEVPRQAETYDAEAVVKSFLSRP